MKKLYVYEHHVIDANLWYVGVTSKPKERFQNDYYKTTSLWPYIKDSGVPFKQNKNIETIVLPVSDREFALRLEDMLILKYRALGQCINEVRSGHLRVNDNAAYRRELRKKDPERHRGYVRKWRKNNLEEVRAKDRIAQAAKRSTPAGKIYNRVASYNRRNNPIITPSEAVEMFELTGWVPTFVKHDDLLHADAVVQR